VEVEKVTTDWMEAQVAKVAYVRRETLTICIITLNSGFKLIGESACMNPADYNKIIGDKLARENAMRQLWKLEGYRRMQNAHEGR
jgi:hypothetical protein